MKNTNCHFPLIIYQGHLSAQKWGQIHGESYRDAISELAQIRKELMLAKNPKLKSKLEDLGQEQFNVSKTFSPKLAEELVGIAQGANLTVTDLVILNNYTDFRDIILPDEGCSTVFIGNKKTCLAGQTWDMHRSAKNYLCLISIEKTSHEYGTTPAQLVLSLVGCLGLMGTNTRGEFIGVNNINTKNAKAGLIWPFLVRESLVTRPIKETSKNESTGLSQMQTVLMEAPVTSGHNYLIADKSGGKHLEITPTEKEIVSSVLLHPSPEKLNAIIHTNHCLGKTIIPLEDKNSISSTTFERFTLLEKKSPQITSLQEFKEMLGSHDGHPKSICSHYESGAQDPSFTCGGGVSDLKNGGHIFWRGCKKYDDDYKEYQWSLNGDEFIKVSI